MSADARDVSSPRRRMVIAPDVVGACARVKGINVGEYPQK